ncbi:MAG: hypothetical protein COU46_03300 [Candidatus Niyogibacteria bacterium CG10_big_fil_rev_8_21_14_0_10_42_19]|uniref:Uncharacterized protein n=1 Tax=Candidatus Niyogibacteria bacterium CG10_big_fil_rev_8_21_14_0_10_42_19 TaxID=1974725 RepID=A0A2H0TH09_9BACT|nr:MAG: hypothetical protein COU46_03300 [Candidatus Niyogibacteria bacterium CG10_big_fil_rev_8_21_14_0_10_42_19]
MSNEENFLIKAISLSFNPKKVDSWEIIKGGGGLPDYKNVVVVNNLGAIKNIRSRGVKIFIIAVVSSQRYFAEAKGAGANCIFTVEDIIGLLARLKRHNYWA